MRIVLKPGSAFALAMVLIALSVIAFRLSIHHDDDGVQSAHLVSHWKFEEGSGRTVRDSSRGGAHPGTFQGDANWAPGLIGAHALHLPGAGSFVDIAQPVVNTSQSFTVTACVKILAAGGFQTFASIDGDRVSGFYLQLRSDTGKFGFAILPADDPGNNNPALASASEAPEVGRWYQLTGVYDAAARTVALYINGVLAQSVPCTSAWQANGHTAIGRGLFDSNRTDFVNGDIDDVRFYDTALSAEDVLALVKSQIPEAALQTPAPVANGPATLTIDVARSATPVSPTLYGLMTEEINHSYDGGLYGELIQNRAFQDDPHGPAHWTLVQDSGGTGRMDFDTALPLSPSLAPSLKLSVTAAKKGQRVGIANDGYWGIPIKPNTTYQASFYAKAAPGFTGLVTLSLESADGKTTFAHAEVSGITGQWQQYHAKLTTPANVAMSAENRFVISVSTPGTVWLNLISLFPPTYHDRPNGNRTDLMEKMAAMKPTFLRLPGGNYLEGDTIAERFDWKKTIGPLTARPGHQGPWRYRSSDGMGLLEFLQWCEDLHMQPVLAVFAGYSLRHVHIEPGAALAPYVQDALDEIEYVTGDTHTKWGAERAKDGHPVPFPLTYVEIGNEDGFDTSGSYDGRFSQFYDAIKKRYPRLQIIATTKVKNRVPDVIDEHYYRSPADFEGDVHHYDRYDRKGPKIFVGEWASNEGKPTPNLNSALGDAAWMTGMERNSDIVVMHAYAPLLVNINSGASQWGTNLIGYDALSSYGSPSYYAQQIFSSNVGDRVVTTDQTGGAALFTSVTRSTKSGTLYIKLVNASGSSQTVHLTVTGAASVAPTGTAIVLSGSSPTDTNNISEPTRIAPKSNPLQGLKPNFDYEAPPYSVNVLVIPAK